LPPELFQGDAHRFFRCLAHPEKPVFLDTFARLRRDRLNDALCFAMIENLNTLTSRQSVQHFTHFVSHIDNRSFQSTLLLFLITTKMYRDIIHLLLVENQVRQLAGEQAIRLAGWTAIKRTSGQAGKLASYQANRLAGWKAIKLAS
jgi:hypothetical protein